MRRSHEKEMEEVVYKITICKFCQNKDSCNIVENNVVFCTGFRKSNSIERLVDFYGCKKGHRFGVDHINNEFRKNSILCPVCRNPAFFKEMMKFKA